MERDLAYRAGLGWFGKNSMLINKKEGSYFIIGSILLNQSFEMLPEVLDVDHCGQCNACVEACPTQAIDGESRTLIANKCLSTFTIEIFKDADPPEGIEKSRGEIFGCDICQDVCPWNKKPLQRVMAKLNLQSQFQFLKEWFYERSKSDLLSFFQEQSNRGLKRKLLGTPFDLPGKVGWIKNLKALLSISK
jgi:epoxyqueuosine reductase